MQTEQAWTEVISARSNLFDLKLRQVWQYRDLIRVFVRRDFVSVYKQTVLGPLWHFLSPIFGAFINVLLFNSIAGLSTEGAPPILFQLLSFSLWGYFTHCFSGASSTFQANAAIFSKVYFPRLTVPIAHAISALFQLGIRLVILAVLWVHFFRQGAVEFFFGALVWFPLLLLLISVMGLSLGIIASSLTVKYKDMQNFISYGINFLMYISAVVYPLSALPEEYRFFAAYNPLVPLMEGARYAILGIGSFAVEDLLWSVAFTLVVFFPAVLIFNYTERTFIDKV
ncbi:MAG: ABC transporter permease [Bernardetiaceae bacterium]